MVSRGRGRASERDAIRDLVSRLTNATNRRERSEGGTPEFREADAARLRYRHILLDDELFERFIRADGQPGSDVARARKGSQASDDAANAAASTRSASGRPGRRPGSTKRR
jgi:hypothetical protein